MSSVQKLTSKYFLYGTNNWLIRDLLYSHHDVFRKFSESCRQIFGKLMRYYSNLNFVRIKKNIFTKIFEMFYAKSSLSSQ